MAIQQVFEPGPPTITRVRPLNWLPELHLVAHQDQIGGRKARSDQVRQRHLTGLIDEQVVEGPT